MLLKYFYRDQLRLDIMNKFNYFLLLKIPQIKKIIILFKFADFKSFFLNVLVIKFIGVSNYYVTSKYRRFSLLLKLKNGKPVRFKVTLKNILMEKFFIVLVKEIFPYVRPLNFNIFNFSVPNYFLFKKLSKFFRILDLLTALQIVIVFNSNSLNENLYIKRNLKIF